MKNVIVLHPKQLEDEEINDLVTHVDRLVYDAVKDPCDVKSAREVFLEFEKKHGKPVNWTRWTRHVVGPKEAFSKEPRFHILVVAPESIVGKATADIVSEAIRAGISTILRLTPDATLVKVTKVVALDPDSLTRGWVVA